MADPAWQERYRRRAGVEGTLSRGVRAFGMRRSRYVGLAKSGLQQVCIAAAMNASRVVRWPGATHEIPLAGELPNWRWSSLPKAGE